MAALAGALALVFAAGFAVTAGSLATGAVPRLVGGFAASRGATAVVAAGAGTGVGMDALAPSGMAVVVVVSVAIMA